MINPGDIFTIIHIDQNKEGNIGERKLERSISTYGKEDTEFIPSEDKEYIMCQDGFITMNKNYDNSGIGWYLIQENNKYYYRVMQVNFFPIEIKVQIIGKNKNIPMSCNRVCSGMLHMY